MHLDKTQESHHTNQGGKMLASSYLKTLQPLQVFPTKSPSSSLSATKIKTLIHTLVVTHVSRILRALSRWKSLLIEILKENQPIHFIYDTKKKDKNRKKIFFGSFRLHYNWCSSSHVLTVPASVLEGFASSRLYYDSTWNSIITPQQREDNTESQLSGYLHWLEEKVQANSNGEGHINDIDRLADLFIASSHEKFRLEKQESDRRFQETLSRSM